MPKKFIGDEEEGNAILESMMGKKPGEQKEPLKAEPTEEEEEAVEEE